MFTKHPLRIVNYAVNGLGLGHLTRLTAVSRHVRRIATTAGVATEITFLSSSESDALCYAHGFASFKIPSKSSVALTRIGPQRYRKIAKQWIWNAVNLLSPDILVVDTFPAGSFNELYDVLDFGQKNVFMYRAVKPDVALQPAFQSALRGYHSIIKPTEQGTNNAPVPDDCAHRVTEVGEILIRSRDELVDRDRARALLDIPADAVVVYCTIGGGGDLNAATLVQAFRELAEHNREYLFVIGAGPLYRGAELHAQNIRWTQRLLMMEYFKAFDCAITAGGFNSVNELLHCGIPCVFLPQERSYDDQFKRVQLLEENGVGLCAQSLQATELSALIDQLLENRERFSAHAERSVPRNCARDAAVEILCATLPRDRVDDACELLYHAQLDQQQLSLADEFVFCEILSTLTSISKTENAEHSLIAHESRAAHAAHLLAFALSNNRDIRAVLRALRAYKRLQPANDSFRASIEDYIIQPPTESELLRDQP